MSGDNNPTKRPEVKVKLSEAAIKKWEDPDCRAKLTALIKAAMNRPEVKAKRVFLKLFIIWNIPELERVKIIRIGEEVFLMNLIHLNLIMN